MNSRSRLRYRIDRALSGGLGRQLIFYIAVVLFLFLLLWGLAILIHIPIRSEKATGFGDFWTMLFFFYDGGLEGTLPDNRWFVYLVNLLGSIVMGGILIATITNFLQSHTAKAEEGLLRYRLSDHTVFIGYHESAIPILRSVVENNGDVVVLSEQPASEIRDRISTFLDKKATKNVVVYHGLRTNKDELDSLCIDKSSGVFIFPSQDYTDTDSTNLDVLDCISRICEDKGRTNLECTAIFKQEITGAGFERADVNDRIKKILRFNPVLYYDSIAKALLAGTEYGNFVLDRDPITVDSDKYVHLFIIGLGEMGQALFCQAVRQLHFPNYTKAKSVITLVGNQEEIQQVKERYREFFTVADRQEDYTCLGDILDLSVRFLQRQDLDSSMDEAIEEDDSLVTVAVCYENTADALKRALSLPRSVYEKCIPVWVYKPDSDSMVKLIGENSYYSNIVPFGSPEKLDFNYGSLLLAQRINWVYSYYSQKGTVPERLPDETEWNDKWIPAWNNLSIKNKWSNLHNAESIPVKVRSFGLNDGEFTLTEGQVDVMARVEHNRWVAETLLAGFRPPTDNERNEMIEKRELKDTYKRRLIHLDLCGFNDLLPDAKGVDVRDYDRMIVASIPLLFKDQL